MSGLPRAPPSGKRPARPGDRPGSRRFSVGLTLLTLLCAPTALFAVSVYVGLDPGDSQIGIPEEVAFHYPLLIVHIVTSVIALLPLPLQLWSCSWPRSQPREVSPVTSGATGLG